jgi:hypothetical protein
MLVLFSDIPRIPGLVGAIFRLSEARRNEIRSQPTRRQSKMASRSAGLRRNSLLCLHQSASLLSPSVASDRSPVDAGAGDAVSRAMSDSMSWNICRDTATSASWNVT